jgi:hypothetical protein
MKNRIPTILGFAMVAGALWLAPVNAGAQPQRVNLARLQSVTSDSAAAGKPAAFATDGTAGNANAWASSGAGPHWLKITLPLPLQLAGAQLYLGADDTAPITNFSLQYFSGNTWVAIPGASFTGNTATVLNVPFTNAVTASMVRLYTTDASATVREIALFASNGYPLGTDVSLNAGKKCLVLASSTAGVNYPGNAVDGYAGTNSGWQTASVNGPHTLEVDFPVATRVGSAQIYSGSATAPALAGFTVNYWNGSAWAAIPGSTVTGNTQRELNVTFVAPISTTKVQLVIPGNGAQFVREFAVFPAAAGLAEYPLWTDVVAADPPATTWETYGDGFWSLVNAADGNALVTGADGSVLAAPNTNDFNQQFQVLYNLDSDTFRLRNRAAWQCAAAQNAGAAAGTAVVVEPAYHAMPHELWRFQNLGGGLFRIVNVGSGLALQSGAPTAGAVTLAVPAADPRQSWQFVFRTIYPRKGVAGNEASWARFGSSWDYNWSRNPSAAAPAQVAYSPQQWNGAGIAALPQWYPQWHVDAKPTALFGFNEPDLAGQANMTVSAAISLWPQLQAADLPLLSPATAWAFSGWLSNYYAQAASAGLRNDYTAVHWYSYPTADSLVNHLQSIYNTWGKPLWLTEFSSGNSGVWSEEGNYTFLAEFLWRTEDLPWLRRYGIFCYSQDPPANPWDQTSPPSAIFKSDGVTFTTLGELYAAWDADRTIRAGTNYLLHNKGACFRLSNTGAAAPNVGTIYSSGTAVQWQLVAAPAASRYYIVSAQDGRALSWNGSALGLAAPGATGSAVEWIYTPNSNGYFFIDHAATSARLSLTRLPAGGGAPTSTNLTVAAAGTVNDNTRWRFIKPYQAAPLNVTAAPGNAQIVVTWNSVAGATSYSFRRATVSGGPYVTLATGLAVTNYVDAALAGNVTYYYVVSAVNAFGESANSNEAAAIPGARAINAGGSTAGWFAADAGFSGGSVSDTKSTIDLSGLANPAPQAVYQYNRYGTSTYTVTNLTPNAACWVRLHFSEAYWTAPGKRVFNILINGTTVAANFDIYAAAGAQNRAVIREFYAAANGSGQMTLQFATVTDNAQINGIEVLKPQPMAPTGLAAAADSAQVSLTWQPAAGAASYNVYRASSAGGPYLLISTGGSVTEPGYIDSTASYGNSWFYAITAVNPYGESGRSDAVSASLFCAPPPPPAAGNNGPIFQGMTLNLSAGAVPGATYHWTGPNGFSSTNQNPSIAAATTANSGSYAVTARIGSCESPAANTVVTVNPPAAVDIAFNGTNVVLSWPGGALQSSTNVTGPWSPVDGAVSPYWVAPAELRRFYRLQLQ